MHSFLSQKFFESLLPFSYNDIHNMRMEEYLKSIVKMPEPLEKKPGVAAEFPRPMVMDDTNLPLLCQSQKQLNSSWPA